MPHDLTSKVALVTGATRGIGRAIAERLAGAGATIVVCSRKAEAVAAITGELVAQGHRAMGIPANVGRPGEVARLAAEALAAAGGIDILVNNAAANPVYGPTAETSSEAFDKIIAVNLKAPFELARALLPSMIARGGGVVINMSSIGGLSPEEGLGIYSVSKAALISLTKVMAREWGVHNVRANAICPGFIRTDFSQVLWKDESRLRAALDRTPLGRLGEPQDVADVALYLASDAGSFCTGSVFTVDGGYSA